MDPIEMYKIRMQAGVIHESDPIYMLMKYIKTIENENEKLRSEIINQQNTNTTPIEIVREPEPRRPYKKRVRKGKAVRGDDGVTEDSTLSES
mgnify:CR=1 FL=1|tara:strand:- start:23 stop:298 length:276 start_codon:yes stop_codon:yes gene_type:complete